jgi:hypothetical protein
MWTINDRRTGQLVNATICSVDSLCPSQATIQFAENESIWDEYCSDCKEECNYKEFVVQTSALYATIDEKLSTIKGFVENTSVPLPVNWTSIWQDEIVANYVQLEVVIENPRVEQYTQKATSTFVDLISNIGGQTGLWIGISFMSMLEVLEMFVRVARENYRLLVHRFLDRRRIAPLNERF